MLGFFVAFGVLRAATSIADNQIADLINRLQTLSAKESPLPRIDTDLRAAELLQEVRPDAAAQFRNDALRLSKGRPSVNPPSAIQQSRPVEASLSESAKRELVADALAFTKTLEIIEQRARLIDLLDWAEASKVDGQVIQPVARQFLYVVEHTTEEPADYARLSRLRRQYDLSLGSDNSSIRARDALAQLADVLRTDYDFSIPALDSGPVTLKQQRGKVVLLSFWATWCAPCIAEMPMLEKLYRQYHNRGLELLAVSDEEPAEVRAFMRQNGFTFPVLLDRRRVAFDEFGIQAMPASRIIDKTGRLRAGMEKVDEAELTKLLAMAGVRTGTDANTSRAGVDESK